MSVAIKNSIEGTFGRHETFTIRHGWLKRAYDAILESQVPAEDGDALGSELFHLADTHHLLGVGKNMARSIRFWIQATRIAEELDDNRDPDNRRRVLATPTPFGEALLDTNAGLDPYLEDLGSWWLLHWMMLSPGGKLPVWWSAFHTYRGVAFTREQLLDHSVSQVEATAEWNEPSPPKTSTIKKDVLAMLSAYAGTSGSRRRERADDVIDAPLVPLTLVRPTHEDGTFRFGVGPKPGLPPAVAAFASLDFLRATGATARSTLVASLASEPGGPGRAFKLTERDLVDLLTRAADGNEDLITVGTTGGSEALNVVAVEDYGLIAARLLWRHYHALGSPAPEPELPYLPTSEVRLEFA